MEPESQYLFISPLSSDGEGSGGAEGGVIWVDEDSGTLASVSSGLASIPHISTRHRMKVHPLRTSEMLLSCMASIILCNFPIDRATLY